MIQRGDLVNVASQGDFGKPRPALVVQSNLLNELESVIVCPVSSELRTAAFRVTLEPTPANGLKVVSQAMVDKITTLPRTTSVTTFLLGGFLAFITSSVFTAKRLLSCVPNLSWGGDTSRSNTHLRSRFV
jgi:mRNA interferase MazF